MYLTKRELTKLLMVFAIMSLMTGCASPQWYKPQPPVADVPEFWQIMQINSPVDTVQKFELDFGLATKKQQDDYSFWLHELKWALVKRKDNVLIYSMVIPNCFNVAMPSTTIYYGNNDKRKLVQSVQFTQYDHSTILYLTTSHLLQWSQTTTDYKNQTVSVVFTRIN